MHLNRPRKTVRLLSDLKENECIRHQTLPDTSEDRVRFDDRRGVSTQTRRGPRHRLHLGVAVIRRVVVVVHVRVYGVFKLSFVIHVGDVEDLDVIMSPRA